MQRKIDLRHATRDRLRIREQSPLAIEVCLDELLVVVGEGQRRQDPGPAEERVALHERLYRDTLSMPGP
jgi:hypothetical protein